MFKNMKPFSLSFLLFFLFINGIKSQNSADSTIQTFNYKKDFKSILMNSQDQESNLYYEKLLKRFLDNDSTLTNYETLALMIGFTENPKYKPMEDMEKEVEIFDHNNANEFSEAIEKSKSYLHGHPLSLLVLREISYAYGRISKVYEKDMVFDSAIYFNGLSSYYMSLNDRIMEAMIFSGKGRTPENPIFSLGLADGEYFIPNVGFEIEKKNTLWNKNGDFLEHIVAIDKVVNKDFYFVIQHAKLKIDDDSEVKLDEQNHQVKNGKTKKQKSKSKEKGVPVSTSKSNNIVELPIQIGSDSMQTALPMMIDSTKYEKPKKQKSKSKQKSEPVSAPENKTEVDVPVQNTSNDSTQNKLPDAIEATKNDKPKKQKSKSKEKAAPVAVPENKTEVEVPVQMNSNDSMQSKLPDGIEEPTKNVKSKKSKSKSKEKAAPVAVPENKTEVEVPVQIPSSDSMQITAPVIMDSTKNGVQKVD